MTVLEVLKPASRRPVDVSNYFLKALPVAAFGLAANIVFKLLETLATRSFLSAFEVVPKKVEPTRFSGIDNARLFRVQPQASFTCPLPHQCQRPLRFALALTEHYKVIRIPDHLQPT